MIYGNTKGVKRVTLETLENLITDYDKNAFVDRELLATVAEISGKLNREICVYISRSGRVMAIAMGDAGTVELKEFSLRRGSDRFSGVRVIHTHPNGNGRLSEMDLSALKHLRLDAMAAVGVDRGETTDMEVAFLEGNGFQGFYFKSAEMADDDKILKKITELEKDISVGAESTEAVPGTAILVNVTQNANGKTELSELARLADTAGLTVVAEVLQPKASPDKMFCVGQGKLDEVKRLIQTKRADYVVFNNGLTGSQLKNLEEATGVKVLDRSMLILNIFARHATSNEGKLQVELAMMKYTLPKLLGRGKELSRIGGGSGSSFTRGSGETKLEEDRRRLRRQIFELSERIEKLKSERDLRRERRRKSGVKTVAIVGYTNAGKSTLMNNVTKAGVLEEDKLFATLDPVTRKIFVDIKKEYLLTDTVGFIDNLPHEFIDAFRSTLEEAAYADVLVHVVDASSEDRFRQMKVVDDVLESLGAGGKPTVIAYNKCDLVPDFEIPSGENAVMISAKNGKGIWELKQKIEEMLF